MIIGSDNAEMKKVRDVPKEKETVEYAKKKLTSQRGDCICQCFLLLNNLVVIEGKAIFRIPQIGFDAEMLLKKSLERVGAEAESMLRTETRMLA